MLAALSNATLVSTLPLQPPAFGFEGIFHRPQPPDIPLPGSHFQHTLRVSGTVPRSREWPLPGWREWCRFGRLTVQRLCLSGLPSN